MNQNKQNKFGVGGVDVSSAMPLMGVAGGLMPGVASGVLHKYLDKDRNVLRPVAVVSSPNLRVGGIGALRGFFSTVANVAAEGYSVKVVPPEPVEVRVTVEKKLEDTHGYCYLKAVRAECVERVANEYGSMPLLRDLANIPMQTLRPRVELEAIEFTMKDGVAHLHDGGTGGVTAWQAIAAVKYGTASIDHTVRVGSDNVPEAVLPSVERESAVMIPPAVVIDKWMESSPVCGPTASCMRDMDGVKDLMAAHCLSHESCITTWFSKHIGGDIVAGAKTLRDVVDNPRYTQIIVSEAGLSQVGKRKISLVEAEGFGVHLLDGFLSSAFGLRNVWRGTLSELPAAGGFFLDSTFLCGDMFGGLAFPARVAPVVGKVRCGVCGCDVQPEGHAERCRVPVHMTPMDRNLAWLGDALHVYDVRSALLETGVPDSLLTIRMVQFTASSAQADYMKKHTMLLPSMHGASDSALATHFEAVYAGDFRMVYIAWLRGELSLPPVDGRSGGVAVDPMLMHKYVMHALATTGSPVVSEFPRVLEDTEMRTPVSMPVSPVVHEDWDDAHDELGIGVLVSIEQVRRRLREHCHQTLINQMLIKGCMPETQVGLARVMAHVRSVQTLVFGKDIGKLLRCKDLEKYPLQPAYGVMPGDLVSASPRVASRNGVGH